MPHDDCLFCKIIAGNIPSAKVYEDEHVYAFLDISQITMGHTLVIPKIHTKNIYETSGEVAGNFFKRVPMIANAIQEAYNPVGLNLLNNNEAFAGQSVFHLHIHIIPRYDESDGFDAKWVPKNDEFSNEDLQQISLKISDQIKQ